MLSHRDWTARPLRLTLAALVVAVTIAIASFGLLQPMEDGLTARRAALLHRDASGQVAIVEIDARSLAELRSWPWPRDYHAAVVRQLHRAGASLIAFDVDFSARTGNDEKLGAAVREAGNVILPIFAQKASGRAGDGQLLSSRPDAEFGAAWVGGVNIFPDADGLVREYPAAARIDGTVQPSIATLVAEKDSIGDRSFQPDWSIDAATLPAFSFVDVMKGRIRPDDIRGKRVIIGATAIELGDRYAVPRYGVVPGVVVQALAAESMLQDRAVQRTGFAVTFLGILLIAFLLAPRPLVKPARYAVAAAAVLSATIVVPILVQRQWPVSVDSAPWYVALILAVLVQAAVEANRRIRLRAYFDADTGLPNRPSLEKALAATQDHSILVTASIDRFEHIRDALGLRAGNLIVRAAADRVAQVVQSQVYRIGPDVLAWAHADHDEGAVEAILRQLQREFREPVESIAGPADVTFVMGLHRAGPGEAPVLSIEHALAAIGTARSAGHTSSLYHGVDPQLRRQLSMMGDLRRAMDEGRLHLVYQPKQSFKTGRFESAEALVRWRDVDGNTISPDEFIPLAEATGVIREITAFALRAALADISAWASRGQPMRVAVNVSALDLGSREFAADVEALLDEAGVPPAQLTLEVTESALMRSPADATATLARLREAGIRLSIDDYGTGQSTLSYLKLLPVHELKIDKSFVMNLETSESDAIMVRSTIDLAHDLGLQVVAEGIENQATLDALRKLGCDYGQGYLLSKPLAPADLFQLISARDAGRRVA